MAASTKDLIVRFLADTKDLVEGTAKAEGGMNKLKAAAAAAGGAYVAHEAIDYLKDATQAAEEDKKSQELLATQIRDTTHASDDQIAGVEKFIDKTSRATGVMDDKLRPAYSQLVRATGDTKEAQTEFSEAMDISAARGIDLQTVTAALEKAHNGHTTALGRLGLATKDASGNALTLDQILQQATKTYAGAAEAAITPSERWKVSTHELSEQIGNVLLPAVEKLESVGAAILNWFASLSPHMQLAIEGGIGLAVAIAGVTIAVGFLTTAVGALTAILGVLTSPVTLVVLAIAALVAGLIYAYTHFQTFHDTVNTTLTDAMAIIKGFADTATALWQKFGGDIIALAKGTWDTIKGTVEVGINAILAVVQPLIDIVQGKWGKAWDDFKSHIGGVFGGIGDLLSGQIEIIKGLFGGLIDFVGGIPGKIAKALAGMWDALWQDVSGALAKVVSLWNAVADRTHISIHVPSWVPEFGGKGFDADLLPHLDTGGTIAQTGIAVVHKGETVTPAGRGGGSIVVTGNVYVQMTGQYDPDKIVEAVQAHALVNTGVRIPNGVITV